MRFPEFSGEWEETTLGKISEITKGSGISKDQLSEQGSPCILYGELYTKYKSEVIGVVYSRTELESSSLVKSKANDVIIPCSGETAIDISTARCVPFNNILLGGDLNIIRLKHDDGGFFAYQLDGARKKEIARVAQGVSVVHLYGENLKHIRVYHPVIEEQKKIIRLLSLIDERIATQNKIIEDLKKLKSAIIEEHYKQSEKQSVPVADLGEPFSVSNLSKDDLTDTGTPCVIYGELFTTYGEIINHVESYTKRSKGMTLSKKGDLLFPSSTTVDAVSLIAPSNINVDNVILGGDMFGIHISSNYDAQYLSYYFNHIAKKQLAKYAKGSTIIHLHYKDIEKANLLLPCLIEQKKIAHNLILLDEKIHNGNAYLQLIVKQKQYMLRHMFI